MQEKDTKFDHLNVGETDPELSMRLENLKVGHQYVIPMPKLEVPSVFSGTGPESVKNGLRKIQIFLNTLTDNGFEIAGIMNNVALEERSEDDNVGFGEDVVLDLCIVRRVKDPHAFPLIEA